MNSLSKEFPLRRMIRYALGAALLALLIPLGVMASPVSASPPVTQSTSIVFDPGPKNRCFGVVEEFPDLPAGPQSTYYDTSGCRAVDNELRADDGCFGRFPYTDSSNRKACPAWDFVTVNWKSDQRTKYPGYDGQVSGNSGSPLKLGLENNAQQVGDCKLREVAFSYHYPSSSLRRPAAGQHYNFADGRLKVSYDALAKQSGPYACGEKRAILTTDLIYNDGARKNVISVVHFNPGKFMQPNADGVFWNNNCQDNTCRVTVQGQEIAAGTTSRVSVDFTAIAEKYRSYLGNAAVPADSKVIAIQMVNSTVGADLRTEVSNASVTLEPPA
ncbi:hypothetical protein [Streptomyces scopuliridis]|uniref:hypothetical protein n=1 Tax=Streptomyces scopuliridis TaxID=452529 RepID=UPI0035E0C8B0